MTGQDLIAAAMRSAGTLASGETPPSAEVNDAQLMLNQMLEAWGTENLNIFTLTRNTFNFVASQQAYTLGTGGNFNIARPANIEYVSYLYNANPAQPLENRIKMYSDQEWADIPIKDVPNVLPEGVYDDGGFPFRTLNYWPIPNDSSVQTIIGSWTPLTQFTDLVTDNTFPPGYIDAIKYNLALRIAADFNRPINPAIALFAKEGIARIKGLNVQPVKVKMDPIVSGGAGGHYDWRTDEYR